MAAMDENTYRLLVDAVIDQALYMLDAHGCVRSWNRGAEYCKGYAAGEIVGRHFGVFYTDEDRLAGKPAQTLLRARTEGRHESEGWRVRKNGERFWAHEVIDPILDDDGRLIGYAMLTRDLTERRRADEQLRRSEEQFRLLVQGVEDYAIYMLDPEGRVSSWNTGAQRIKGYAPAEIIGRHFSTFYTPADREAGEPERGLETARATGRFENEGQRLRKDGSVFWAHIVIDRILDESGDLVGFAKITRDITARRETDQALSQAREALFQSQKMEAIGQLTGGVAHDFNNLLMAVLASLELLGKRLEHDPQALALLSNAIAGAQRGAALTQRMLAFARRQELKLAAIDLKALVQDMAHLLQRSVGPQISIDTVFPLRLAKVQADGNQVELALLNLAMNARDAMPQGGRLVLAAQFQTVLPGHRTRLAPGDYVCLSVADEGHGMDEATLSRAAEPFFTTKGVGKGTGLGLSMVHGLAEQSGGRLMLLSEPGRGTTAELWLPVAQVAAAADEPPGPTLPLKEHKPLRVLVVDDDPLIVMTLNATLEDLGHVCHTAHSGQEALALLDRGLAVDVVVTDQAMPGMTGIQLAEAIKARWPRLPLVLATGYAELPEGTRLDAVRLAKPFGRAQLVHAITQATELVAV